MENKKTEELRLEETGREIAYYRRLAEENSNIRLRETEELSIIINELKSTQSALQKVRGELERRVEERTDELVSANLVLKHEILERKGVERALRESEEKYRELVENANSIILRWSQKGNVTFLNEFGLQFFGYTEKEIIGSHVVGTIVPEHEVTGRDLGPLMDRIIANPQDFEHNINENMRRNGERVWISWTNKAVLDKEGQVLEVLSIGSDITERRNAEDALKKSEKKYRQLHESMIDGFVSVDMNGNFLECNEIYRKMLGYSEAELAAITYVDITPEKWHAVETDIVQNQIIKRGYSDVYEKEYRRKDGTIFPVELHAVLIRDEQGQPASMWAIARDITKRKRAEEEIENLARFPNEDPSPVLRLNDKGTILYANKASRSVLTQWNTAIGQPVPTFLLTEVAEVFETQSQKVVDLSVGTRVLSCVFAPVVEEGYVNLYAIDITERNQAIEKLRKALESTVQAIASVVEVRDPYTAGHERRVATLAGMIATNMDLPADQIAGLRMAALIHDIGKISVPAEILIKPTKLSDIEFRLIKTHAQSGYDLLKDMEFPWPIARMVLEHHERIDGSGYPQGLTGENVLLESKILAVADAVEAIASDRPYRPALGIGLAMEEVKKNKGKTYDNVVADVCLRVLQDKGFQLENL